MMEDVAAKLASLEQREKSNTHRIDKLEERQDNLEKLTDTISVLANEQEHIKSDVGEIKADVKTLTDFRSSALKEEVSRLSSPPQATEVSQTRPVFCADNAFRYVPRARLWKFRKSTRLTRL